VLSVLQGSVTRRVSRNEIIPSFNLGALCRLFLDSGDMNSTARKNALKKIAQDDSCTVLISSIYAGGVGMSY
jgi:hypothetical protein